MKTEIKDSIDGQFYWVLIGLNGEPLAKSEMYTRKEKAMQTAELLGFEIVDLTTDKRKK